MSKGGKFMNPPPPSTPRGRAQRKISDAMAAPCAPEYSLSWPEAIEVVMPKFLVQASYTAEGFQGLRKDGGSGRKEAINKAVESLGGKVEAFYFGFGEYDA